MRKSVRLTVLGLAFVCLAVACDRTAVRPPEREADSAAGFAVPADPPKSRYVIDARIDPGQGVIEGKERIVLKNSSRLPLEVVAFDWRLGSLTALEVSAQGRALLPRDDAGALPGKPPVFYTLPAALAPGDSLELEATFREKSSVESGNPVWQSSNWYPRLWWDGIPQHDSFSVKLDIPEGYALAATGLRDEKTGRFKAPSAKSFGVFLGKGMKTETRETEGVRITSIFTEKGAKAAAICLETAVEAVGYFKKWLGFYPFSTLNIIPGGAGRWGGYPVATGIVAIHGLETYKDGESPQHWQHITSHEIGHEYWGEWVLDPDDPAWLWISMGIYADTDYMIARGYDPERRAHWTGNFVRGISMYYDMTVDVPPAFADQIRYDHNNTVIHSKGPAIINALEVVLGRAEFERIYKKALRIYGGKRLGWREFQKFCEAESGLSLQWFFDAWVRSNQYLCYAAESQECRAEGSGFRTEIRIRKLGTMAMPVPVKAVFEDGTEQVALTDRTKIVDVLGFTSRTKLKEVVLDPERKLAMAAKPLPAISRQAAAMVAYGWAAQDAPKVFEALRGKPVGSPDLWYRLGMELYEANRPADALFCFDRVAGLESDPVTAFAAQGWLGLLEDLRGRRPAALEHYREALKLDSGKSMSHGRLRIEMNCAWIEERLKTPFSRESTVKIPDRPTAKELTDLLAGLGWTNEGRISLLILEKTKGLEIAETSFWLKLGLLLFDGGFYRESVSAFEKLAVPASSPLYRFTALTWLGHLNDLLGRRAEAVACYRDALENEPGESMTHSQYGITIDRAWVEERLKIPFARPGK